MQEADARLFVAGYTLRDDVSAREFQFAVSPPRTSFAKGTDGFAPMGAWQETPDEAGEPWTSQLRCRGQGAVAESSTPAEFARVLEADLDGWRRVVQAAGIRTKTSPGGLRCDGAPCRSAATAGRPAD